MRSPTDETKWLNALGYSPDKVVALFHMQSKYAIVLDIHAGFVAFCKVSLPSNIKGGF